MLKELHNTVLLRKTRAGRLPTGRGEKRAGLLLARRPRPAQEGLPRSPASGRAGRKETPATTAEPLPEKHHADTQKRKIKWKQNTRGAGLRGRRGEGMSRPYLFVRF